MPRYLLDTHILSDLVRHPQGRVAACIAQVGEGSVCTSIIVASELRFGAAKRNAPKLTAQVEVILAAIDVRPFDTPADHEYAKLRLHLEQAGTPIQLLIRHFLSGTIRQAVGCAMRTDWLNGAHGAPYGLADSPG